MTILASIFPNALDWIITSGAYVTAGPFFPILLGYFFRNTNFLTTQGAMTGAFLGIIGTVSAQLLGIALYPIFGLTFSAIALMLGSYIIKNKTKNTKVD